MICSGPQARAFGLRLWWFGLLGLWPNLPAFVKFLWFRGKRKEYLLARVGNYVEFAKLHHNLCDMS